MHGYCLSTWCILSFNKEFYPKQTGEFQTKQDSGLQCQTPLKDLKFTDTVVTVYVQTRLEFKA